MSPEVKAGIEYLDTHHPGWAGKINIEGLSMQHSNHCVLAQVFEQDFWSAIENIDPEDCLSLFDWCRNHGFLCKPTKCGNLNYLTDEWKEYLTQLQEAKV